MNQATAKLRHLRMGPRKVRLVVDLIRGKHVDEALSQLQFSKKHATRPVKKLLESAIANAVHNHNLKRESLVVKTAFVDEGKTLYRWMPRAFGRATPLRKRLCHITLVLEGEVGEVKKEVKTEEKAEVKAEKTEKKETKKAPAKKKAAPKKPSTKAQAEKKAAQKKDN